MKNLIRLFVLVVGLVNSVSAFGQNGLGEEDAFELIPDHLAYLYSVAGEAGSVTLDQLYGEGRRWENGRKLRVCFYSGNAVVVKLVRTYASEWNAYSGVTFDFGPEDQWFNCLSPRAGFPEIRIGFSERGYWSYVGSDSERYGSERAPSMNLNSFNIKYSESRFTLDNVLDQANMYHKAVIRHEFGHALGLLHEHQHPSLDCYNEIKWTGPGNVYEYFSKSPYFWDKEKVERNMGLIKLADPDYVAGEPDLKSLMMYSLPVDIFKNGSNSKCVVLVNYEISEKDKNIVSKLYSKSGNGAPVPVVRETIDASYVKPAPQFSGHLEAAGYMSRVLVDLESDDTAIRRNARARLSDLLEQNEKISDLNNLIVKIPQGSYRYKLGLATALSSAEGRLKVSTSALSIVRHQASVETDSILKSKLGNAAEKLIVQE